MDTEVQINLPITKLDEERRLVHAVASVARKADGSLPKDTQGDVIDTPEALRAWEDAFLDFFSDARTADDMHVDFDVAKFAGGLVFTPDLTQALGIPDGTVGTQAVVSFRIPKTARGDALWQDIKTGKRSMMSIVARGKREPVEIPDEAA